MRLMWKLRAVLIRGCLTHKPTGWYVFFMMIDEILTTQTRRRDAEATIANLKKATTHQLLAEGLGNLSIKPIIDKANVSRGALFHHFPTKNHLIAAAFADLLEGAADQLYEHARALRGQEISKSDFVANVRSVFCSDMFVGSMEIAIAIRVDEELMGLVEDALDRWWKSLSEFWHTTFELPGTTKEEAMQHWNMASNLLRGHAFSASYQGSPNKAEPFCASFETMMLRDALVRIAS